jgi:hypothetical protein
MLTRPLKFRTRAYHTTKKASQAGRLVFWSFHSNDERASQGFVYENEICESCSFSRLVTPRIGWREALEHLALCEAEADKKFRPVNERAYNMFIRLHRYDSYDGALPYREHPLLKLEQGQSSLQAQADKVPKIAPRSKPPRGRAP